MENVIPNVRVQNHLHVKNVSRYVVKVAHMPDPILQKEHFQLISDFITPVAAERQMLRRGRARTGFRSYRAVESEKRSGFDSLYGAGTIKIRRMALSS